MPIGSDSADVHIVLTDKQSGITKKNILFSLNSGKHLDGSLSRLCWTILDKYLNPTWEGGGAYLAPPDIFV